MAKIRNPHRKPDVLILGSGQTVRGEQPRPPKTATGRVRTAWKAPERPATPLSASQAVYEAMTEKELEAHVEVALRYRGFRLYHTRLSKGSEPGFPDIVATPRSRGRPISQTLTTIYLELKREGEKLTPAQEDWRDDLIAAGQWYRLVHPGTWPAVLAEIEALEEG